MAWKKVLPMDERRKFVLEAELCIYIFTGLCEKYGISRKTGYKWYNRYLEEGFECLVERGGYNWGYEWNLLNRDIRNKTGAMSVCIGR